MPGQTWQGGGSGDGFVCKFDTYGNLKWTRQFGSNGYDAGYGVAAYGGGVYVVGPGFLYSYPGPYRRGPGPFMVIKFDVYGNVKWISVFGSSLDILTDYSAPRAVSVYGSSVLVAGYQTWASLPGKPDAFVYKFDTSGKYMWSKNIVTSGADEAYGVAVSSAGNAYVVGRTTGALPGQTNKGGWDAFVRKYDASGNLKWTKQFGTSKIDSAYAVAIYGSGIYVGGETTGSLARQNTMGYYDPFLRKYDAYGNVKWTKQFGTSYPDEGIKTVAAASSGVYAAGIIRYGTFPGYTNKGGYDVFISKFYL